MGKYIYEGVKDFDLDNIFDCGQCFRWSRQPDGSYTGIARGKIVNMSLQKGPAGEQAGRYAESRTAVPPESRTAVPPESRTAVPPESRTDLVIDNCTDEDFRKIWRPYLDLDRDYGAIKNKLSESDNVMAKAIQGGSGIRILRQELWETMVSFIISQNNNIPRIKGCIENLSRLFGRPAGEYRGTEYFNVPSAEVMANLTAGDLAPCRLGYRAPYLVETARQVMAKGGIEAVAAELEAAATPESV